MSRVPRDLVPGPARDHTEGRVVLPHVSQGFAGLLGLLVVLAASRVVGLDSIVDVAGRGGQPDHAGVVHVFLPDGPSDDTRELVEPSGQVGRGVYGAAIHNDELLAFACGLPDCSAFERPLHPQQQAHELPHAECVADRRADTHLTDQDACGLRNDHDLVADEAVPASQGVEDGRLAAARSAREDHDRDSARECRQPWQGIDAGREPVLGLPDVHVTREQSEVVVRDRVGHFGRADEVRGRNRLEVGFAMLALEDQHSTQPILEDVELPVPPLAGFTVLGREAVADLGEAGDAGVVDETACEHRGDVFFVLDAGLALALLEGEDAAHWFPLVVRHDLAHAHDGARRIVRLAQVTLVDELAVVTYEIELLEQGGRVGLVHDPSLFDLDSGSGFGHRCIPPRRDPSRTPRP